MKQGAGKKGAQAPSSGLGAKVRALAGQPMFRDYQLLALSALVILCTVITHQYYFKSFQDKLSLQNSHAFFYLYQRLDAGLFVKDWLHGALDYDFSLPMVLWREALLCFGLTPESTVKTYVFLELLLYASSLAVLGQALFNRVAVSGLLVVVGLASPLPGINLANFGAGFGMFNLTLYYMYANALRLLAMGAFIRQRIITAFVLLAVGAACHLLMGLFGAAFLLAYYIWRPREALNPRVLIGIGLLGLTLILLMAWIVLHGGVATPAQIDTETWFRSTRVFSFHWFPIHSGEFSALAGARFLPLALLSLMLVWALGNPDLEPRTRRIVVAGVLLSALLTAAGVIFSEYLGNVTLVKLSLHRASDLISFFAVALLVGRLAREIACGPLFLTPVAIYALLAFIFSSPGLAVLPMLLLAAPDLWRGRWGAISLASPLKWALILLWSALIVGALFLLATPLFPEEMGEEAVLLFQALTDPELWPPLIQLDITKDPELLIRGGRALQGVTLDALLWAVAVMSTVAWAMRTPWLRGMQRLGLLLACLAMIMTLIWHQDARHQMWWDNEGRQARAFLEAQRWARDNTAPDSLFLVIPYQGLNWRELSRRACLGSMQEWGFTVAAYKVDQEKYERGKELLREFGVELGKGDQGQDPPRHQLQRTIRDNYCAMAKPDFLRLAREYGFEYMVFEKRGCRENVPGVKTVFENKYYFIAWLEN